VRQWQRAHVHAQREHAVAAARSGDALVVGRGVDGAVDGPDRDAELAGEKDRADRVAAAEVEHAHAGLERQHVAETLGEVQDVLAQRVGLGPVGIVATGKWKHGVEHANLSSASAAAT
jgi:hypothetical protein